jgi:hypothetical protein
MPRISSSTLKGYLLEEVVAFLISNAGYRLITDHNDDPHDLDFRANGLQVRGRGGFHQADVLGELLWAPAFGNPIRLFVEAKWRGEGRDKVGIPEVRQAVGILQDINQVLAPLKRRRAPGHPPVAEEERNFCYSYRYALCSTSGFSEGAQTYALAHQIALLDISDESYNDIRNAVDQAGDALYEELEAEDDTLEAPAAKRGELLRRIRATLRQRLWGQDFAGYDPGLDPLFGQLVAATQDIGELFVGVSATGFVILLKADDPETMVRHMRAPTDPTISIHYRRRREGVSSKWQITVANNSLPDCELTFHLPDAMLRALNEKTRRESSRIAAIHLKQRHFSRITIYRMTDAKSLICSLKLNANWLEEAREQIDLA